MFRLLSLFLVLAVPVAARAVPIEIALAGFGATCSGGLYCTTVPKLVSLGGTLKADLGADQALTGIHGTLDFKVLNSGAQGALDVTGGTIDLDGDGDAGSASSFLDFAGGSTLYFADWRFFGPANSFDGRDLYLIATSWTPYPINPSLGRWLAVGFHGSVRPGLSGGERAIPEPSSFALLAAGGLLAGAAVRRRLS